MRKILILLFTLLSFTLSAQIIRTVGIVYTGSLPTHTPSTQGAWVAIDTLTGQWYERDQTAGVWRDMGARLQATNTTGVPSYTPSKQRGRLAINSGDSLYYYQAGVWTHINPQSVNTDNQTLSIDSVAVTGGRRFTVNIQNGNSVSFIDSIGSGGVNTDSTTVLFQDSILIYRTLAGVEYDRDTIRTRGSVTGSGTINYVSKFTSPNVLGNSQIFDDGTNVGIGTVIPVAKVEVMSTDTWVSGFNNNFRATGASPSIQLLQTTSTGGFGIFSAGNITYFSKPTNASYTAHNYVAVINSVGRWTFGSAALSAARVNIRGEGTTSATSSLLVENSAGTDILEIKDAGDLLINGAITAGYGGGAITSNLAFGNLALSSNTTGTNNFALGSSALRLNTTGVNNSAIGVSALRFNTTGVNNSAIGVSALRLNTTGGFNSAIGVGALYSKVIGSNNTALGNEAGRYHTALTEMDTVANSIFIGYRAKALANNQTNQNVVGYDAIGLGSNTNVYGNSSSIQTHLWGALTSGTTTPNANTQFTLRGSGTTNLTSSLLVENSAGSKILEIKDDASVTIGQGTSFTTFTNTINNSIITNNSGLSATIAGTAYTIGQWGSGVTHNFNAGSAGGGNANRTGVPVSLNSGLSTGTGVGGDILFKSSPASVTPGGILNALVTRAIIKGETGQLGIGTTTPEASALADFASTTQGFLMPRMTTAQRDAIASPAAGLMVYDTTTNKVSVHNGTEWKYLAYE